MILYYKLSLAFHIMLSIGLLFFIMFQKGTGSGLFVTNQTSAFGSFKQLNDFVNKSISFMLALFVVNSLALARINTSLNKQFIQKEETVKTIQDFNPEDLLI